MNLGAFISRLIGRAQGVADVTPTEVREQVLQRQDRQAARLRSLDLPAELIVRRRNQSHQ